MFPSVIARSRIFHARVLTAMDRFPEKVDTNESPGAFCGNRPDYSHIASLNALANTVWI